MLYFLCNVSQFCAKLSTRYVFKINCIVDACYNFALIVYMLQHYYKRSYSAVILTVYESYQSILNMQYIEQKNWISLNNLKL